MCQHQINHSKKSLYRHSQTKALFKSFESVEHKGKHKQSEKLHFIFSQHRIKKPIPILNQETKNKTALHTSSSRDFGSFNSSYKENTVQKTMLNLRLKLSKE